MRCVHGLKVVMYFTAHTITPHNSGPDQCISNTQEKTSDKQRDKCTYAKQQLAHTVHTESVHSTCTQKYQCTYKYMYN